MRARAQEETKRELDRFADAGSETARTLAQVEQLQAAYRRIAATELATRAAQGRRSAGSAASVR